MTDTLREVSNEQIAAYQETVSYLARRYHGHHGAEFDDLFQEGQLVVFLALRQGEFPSKDIIALKMRNWVTKCAREGITGYNTREETDGVLG